jgi:iron complex outermembrane receptor protein
MLPGSGLVQIIENGHPMQTFYTKKFLGIDKVTGLSDYMIDDTTSSFFVGNPNPNTLLGISSSFRYNKFTLTANMYGAFGQDIYNGTLMSFLNVGGIKGGGNIALSVFEDPVKESITNSQTPSSRYIMKGSYLKMANLTLSYAAVNVGKTFKGLNIFITGQNLFMITSYPGLDPESSSNTSNNNVPSFGIDFPPYPSKRTFIVGINFSL